MDFSSLKLGIMMEYSSSFKYLYVFVYYMLTPCEY